jgi:RNA polymerase sigma factor (TIGR02999 family)
LCENAARAGPNRFSTRIEHWEDVEDKAAKSAGIAGAAGNGAAEGSSALVSTSDVFPVVYQQLRDLAHAKMNREPAGHTLQTTALVHEVYLRLKNDGEAQWENPRQFFAAAAEAMRRILVERARRQAAWKYGGKRSRVDLSEVDGEGGQVDQTNPSAMLALDEAIDELKQFDARLAEVVMLRYFSGLSVEETAAALESSPRTVKREWSVARAWLSRKLGEERA